MLSFFVILKPSRLSLPCHFPPSIPPHIHTPLLCSLSSHHPYFLFFIFLFSFLCTVSCQSTRDNSEAASGEQSVQMALFTWYPPQVRFTHIHPSAHFFLLSIFLPWSRSKHCIGYESAEISSSCMGTSPTPL